MVQFLDREGEGLDGSCTEDTAGRAGTLRRTAGNLGGTQHAGQNDGPSHA
jgi:hypothetical protein